MDEILRVEDIQCISLDFSKLSFERVRDHYTVRSAGTVSH